MRVVAVRQIGPDFGASECQYDLTVQVVIYKVQLRVSVDTCRLTRVQVLHVNK